METDERRTRERPGHTGWGLYSRSRALVSIDLDVNLINWRRRRRRRTAGNDCPEDDT